VEGVDLESRRGRGEYLEGLIGVHERLGCESTRSASLGKVEKSNPPIVLMTAPRLEGQGFIENLGPLLQVAIEGF
jgi:hypothetical protein